MPITISAVADDVRPHSTVLLFGSGSSVPSGAPSVARILAAIEREYQQSVAGFSLAEVTELVEQKTKDRRRLITTLRGLFKSLRPTGGILNVPLYDWKSVFTTNYDEIIEDSYKRARKPLAAYSSNFDFTSEVPPASTKLFKLHGTISQDLCDGSVARLILTEGDYEHTQDYREYLFDRLKSDLAGSRLIIIGHSLADPDIRDLITRAIAINSKALSAGRITLLMYERDDDRAALFEAKGLQVTFGGIDEFFAAMARKPQDFQLVPEDTDDALASSPALRPVTVDVSHAIEAGPADVSAMFNGWPATHADVAAGLTFSRAIADGMVHFLRSSEDARFAVVLGASGVGKTTASRQALQQLRVHSHTCWEHNPDHPLLVGDWLRVADELRKAGQCGVLFVDDASGHVNQINDLMDGLVSKKLTSLKIICASSRNSWRPRVKTPNLFKFGQEFILSN